MHSPTRHQLRSPHPLYPQTSNSATPRHHRSRSLSFMAEPLSLCLSLLIDIQLIKKHWAFHGCGNGQQVFAKSPRSLARDKNTQKEGVVKKKTIFRLQSRCSSPHPHPSKKKPFKLCKKTFRRSNCHRVANRVFMCCRLWVSEILISVGKWGMVARTCRRQAPRLEAPHPDVGPRGAIVADHKVDLSVGRPGRGSAWRVLRPGGW